uniref:Uncharacterized protein n=1 Tax=Vespula pensylvanica TaxID=30213 RepID=A0A834UGP5_VESPE|nr:hypothetical protein H0235_001327 [Vespula pensylvanica]
MRSVGEQLGIENHDLDQEETLENITCGFEGRRTFVVVSSPAHHRAWDDAVIQKSEPTEFDKPDQGEHVVSSITLPDVLKILEDWARFAKNNRFSEGLSRKAIDGLEEGGFVEMLGGLLDGVHKSTKMKTTSGRSPLFATLDSGFDEVCYGGASSLNPWRHIWTVFFETGCPIWSRREPPC